MSEKKSPFSKLGVAKVDNHIKDKNGNIIKRRMNEVGVLIGTPHRSHMFLKLHNTERGEGQVISFFFDKELEPKQQAKAVDAVKEKDI